MTKLINGKEIAQNLKNELKNEINNLRSKTGKVPGLAVVQVGNVAASSVYVKAKTKSAIEVGIEVIDHHLDEKISENELLELINSLNNQFERIYWMNPEKKKYWNTGDSQIRKFEKISYMTSEVRNYNQLRDFVNNIDFRKILK